MGFKWISPFHPISKGTSCLLKSHFTALNGDEERRQMIAISVIFKYFGFVLIGVLPNKKYLQIWDNLDLEGEGVQGEKVILKTSATGHHFSAIANGPTSAWHGSLCYSCLLLSSLMIDMEIKSSYYISSLLTFFGVRRFET